MTCDPMPWIGKSNVCYPAGNACGECVGFVKACIKNSRLASSWRPGAKVRGNHNIAAGTAIATFPNKGHYNGHTAIYMGQNADGIVVVDQNWPPQYSVQKHTIHWNWRLADDFYVIE
jgi:hypothetical protein